MIKRAIPFLFRSIKQNSGPSPTSQLDDSFQEFDPSAVHQDTSRDPNSQLGRWVPEVNPLRWLVVNTCWCITFAVPVVALLWTRDLSRHFYYTQAFYQSVKITSCVLWVLQSALGTYWFWHHEHLGWVRGIELCFSLYFVVDAFLIIFHRDFSQLTKTNIIQDYGVSFIAYVWALELGIKGLVAKSEGFAAKPIVKKSEDGHSSISNLHP
mmetsp:Transcript_11478/g.19076  ORF Transcript_11478/g.19076 Transcript_11478/m.19076 type:complete len:210 (+) Transcript_11478:73-702(+)